jgi:Ca2+-binding RTX toxin-like protein
MAFTDYDNSLTNLAGSLLAPGSGINILTGSIVLSASSTTAVSYYDGSLAPLGIGTGLLLTSGIQPGTSNTLGWYGQDNSGITGFYNGDADIDAVVNTVFQTQSYDATTLSFDFTVTDLTATSVSFDLVFGSDEYPEWVDQFVDSAIVMVNGVNYALFNHDPMHPLSVISPNLAAGYFQDNENPATALPIEYDGVSHVLKIVAPIIPGGEINHIKIGIADTGDHILDSGIFISNLSAGTIPGSGVVSQTTACDDSNNSVTGSAKDEYFDLKGGDDAAYAGAGDDIVVAGSGNDTVYGGSGDDQLKGDAGNDALDGGDDSLAGGDTVVYAGLSSDFSVVYDLSSDSFTVADSNTGIGSEGVDTLKNIEFAKFGDGLFALSAGGLTPVSTVTPPSNTPGSVIVGGIAAAGNTLTATVSDPDGVSGPVSYQWQASADGVTWNDIGTNSAAYTVLPSDVGMSIQVTASYWDNASTPVMESAVSAAKTILNANSGDLVVTLMQLDAPQGTSVINPFTTLVKDAMDLGVSPSMAAAAIKSVLGIDDAISLQSYDAYAVLQAIPADPIALAVEKVAVQIAILTSLADDDTGVNLTLKILEAAANNQTLNLADAADLAFVLGADISGITDPQAYPEPLREIYDRNKSMSDAIADGGDVGVIETEWQDLLSIQDGIASTSIADLSIHVNQTPTGVATASLANGLENTDYIVSASDLLLSFSDADGDPLIVSALSADKAIVTDNGDGSFTIQPALNYTGPVELTYSVEDGQGGATSASQLFIVAAFVDHEAAGTLEVTGAAKEGDSLVAHLTAVSDPDGSTSIAYQWQENIAGVWTDIAGADTDTLSIPADQSYVGKEVRVVATTTDTLGGATTFEGAGQTIANVNDAPTGSASATLAAGTEDTPYIVSASDLLAGFGDVDGDALHVSGLAASNGGVIDNGDGTFTITPTSNYNGLVDLTYDVIDGNGGGISATQSYTLAAAPEIVTGTAKADTLNGTADDDILYGLGGNDVLVGGAGNDALIGGSGADKMSGGTGNDTYDVDTSRDTVSEATGAGTDTVLSNLTSYTLGANVENLVLQGAAVNGTGNALANNLQGNGAANVLSGMAGDDTIDGGAGADKLIGGAGNDILVGGPGDDIFRFEKIALSETTNVDTISDFRPLSENDVFELENAIFKKLTATGALSADNFHASNDGTPLDANDFIQYDAGTGKLYYDADGSGAGVATHFATLTANPATGLPPLLTAADFLVT